MLSPLPAAAFPTEPTPASADGSAERAARASPIPSTARLQIQPIASGASRSATSSICKPWGRVLRRRSPLEPPRCCAPPTLAGPPPRSLPPCTPPLSPPHRCPPRPNSTPRPCLPLKAVVSSELVVVSLKRQAEKTVSLTTHNYQLTTHNC